MRADQMVENDLFRMRDHLLKAFVKTLEAMMGTTVTGTAEGTDRGPRLADSSLLWQQTFSILPDPLVWVHAPEQTWKAITTAILTNAGLDAVEEVDQRSTWSEVVQQALGGFAAVLTSEVRREITLKKGEEVQSHPPVAEKWLGIVLGSNGEQWRVEIAIAPNLVSVYDTSAFEQILEQPQVQEKPQELTRTSVSKTFDLLLDVSLPVSVSFGKTSLQLKEVLKLNTGSIVELDRFIAEPVDVIINDCIIARGDVVVVDGNYGVRIRQLASREDRLRSGLELAGVTSRRP